MGGASGDDTAGVGCVRSAVQESRSAVEQVTALLRSRVAAGHLAPGERLREQPLAAALGVSRNTLREAFRVLVHERVLEHKSNRGVLVRRLGADEVREIFVSRRLIETAAVRAAAGLPAVRFTDLRAAVADGEAAARRGAWQEVGTADIRFHAALVALAGSRHLDELTRTMSAELRLAFHAVENLRAFHEPFLGQNRALCRLLVAADTVAAVALLAGYLDDAEDEVLRAMAGG